MRLFENTSRGSRGTAARRVLPLLLLALGIAACDDFLATEPKAQLTTDNFFTSEAQAIQATNATYAMLRNWTVHVFAYLGMTDIASDDASKGSVPADAGFLNEMDNFTFSSGNNSFSGTWSGYYQGIYRANVAIANIPDIDMKVTVRDRLVAENKFLRAYYYLFLVRAYGGVPLITEPLGPDEYFQQRATADAVWAQIEQDLTDAIAALPQQSGYGESDIGRASKGAARALLARAHLFQGEWQAALDQASAVISSGEYSLYPDYAELFSPAGENSSETVFEVQTIAVEGGSNGPPGGATQHAQVQGVRGQPNLGWGFNTPSPDLEQSYEEGDPRHEATIMYPWELLPDNSGLVVYLNASMLNNRYNQKVFQPVDNPGGSGNSGVNIRLIRYADVLLIAAEAAQQLGQDPQAQTWVNMVRARARDGRMATLGIQPEMLSDEIAEDVLGLATSSRVMVRYADPNGSAYAAGLRSFDSERDDDISPIPVRVNLMHVITSVGGMPITDMASYRAAVEAQTPGTTVAVTVHQVMQSGGTVTETSVVFTVPVQQLLPDVTATGTALRDAIWAERRSELGMEQHRYFDLVRQGRAQAVLEALSCDDRAQPGECAPISYAETNTLYPIPLGEVAIAGLAQNPGY